MNRLSLGLGLSAPGGGRRGPTDPFAGASLVVDFVAGRYEINATPFTEADFVTVAGAPAFTDEGLAVATDDRMQLPNLDWWTPAEGAFLVDWRLAEVQPAEAAVFSMRGGSGSTRTQIDFRHDAGKRDLRLYMAGGGQSVAVSHPMGIRTRPGRVLASLRPGEQVRVAAPSSTAGAAVAAVGSGAWATPTTPVSQTGLGYRVQFGDAFLNGLVQRVVFWPRALSDAQMLALYLDGDATNLHVLGDSFITAAFVDALFAHLIDERRTISRDGVGGASLADGAARFALTPQYWGFTLVIADGGVNTGETADAMLPAIDDMAGRLEHGRWLYMQPSPGPIAQGSPERDGWEATQAAVRSHVGETRYVETLAALQAAHNGSPEDLADVAAGLVPRSLRTDDIHETAAGSAVRTGAIAARLATLGW